MFFTFFKLCKWFQISQSITFVLVIKCSIKKYILLKIFRQNLWKISSLLSWLMSFCELFFTNKILLHLILLQFVTPTFTIIENMINMNEWRRTKLKLIQWNNKKIPKRKKIKDKNKKKEKFNKNFHLSLSD